MEYRVTLTLESAPTGDRERLADVLDDLVGRVERHAADAGAVADGRTGEPTVEVTVGLDAPSFTAAIAAATAVVDRARAGTQVGEVTAVAAELVWT